MRWIVAAGTVALFLLGTACGGGGGDGSSLRDDLLGGALRVPDDEGVVTAISRETVTLDGARTYAVSEALLSFSAYIRVLEPMQGRRGQYVQIGLDGDTMIWMAGIGAVVDGSPRSVYFTGTLVRVGAGRAEFDGGTVFRVATGVRAPSELGPVQAQIDVSRHQIIALFTSNPRPRAREHSR